MYSSASMAQLPPPINGGLVGGSGIAPDDSAVTINPAALNSSPSTNITSQTSPRGIKRSRSPDVHYDPVGDDDGSGPRKRGRPPKGIRVGESPVSMPAHTHSVLHQVQTPQSAVHPPSHASPTQTSPSRTTPTKPTVLKALPTVRDHTSNELNEAGDEYKPREFDEHGEKKVAPNGAPLGGRQYRCRTFYMPNRGDKLFMLATECAKVLGYRDSYLLFNKNRSLFKIIANQVEKNDLITQDILPSSYRSRQIAIVTARSMYRQFGSRLIVNGRRVRDDYWENKARKQGFTEDDPAGEKRPGAARQREAQAAAEASHATALAALPPPGEIIYSNGPGPMDGSSTMAPLPMINMNPADDLGDYGNVQRPRHEMSGSAYQDRTTPSSAADVLNAATHAAEYNKSLSQQRGSRGKYLNDIWRRPHDPPEPAAADTQGGATTSQAHHSPQLQTATGNQTVGGHTAQQHQMMPPQAYTQQPMHPSMVAQSPVRSVHQQLPGSQMQHRSPTFSMAGSGSHGQHQPSYGYPQGQMWPSAQAQQPPLSQVPIQYQQHLQHSPHMQQPQLQHPQLHHTPPSGSLHQMGYNVMPGAMNPPGYSNVPRGVYQPGPGSQQYMHPSSGAAPQPNTPGWSSGQSQQQHGSSQNWGQGF